MVESIFNALKGQLGHAATAQLSKMLGVSESATSGIVNQALSALMGGMMQKAATPSGASSLLGLIQNSGVGGEVFNDLPNILGSPERTAQVEKTGGGFLTSLFGDKLGPIIDLVGKVTGIGSGKSSSLMSMLVPIVLSYLVKNVVSKGLGVNGLMDVFKASAADVKAHAPQGLTSALGINSLADLGGDAFRAVGDAGRAAANTAQGAARTAAHGATRAAEETGGLMKTLLPLLGLALLGAGLFFGLRSCQTEEPVPQIDTIPPSTVPPAIDGPGRAMEPVGDITRPLGDAMPKMAAVELPGGVNLDLPEGGVLADLVQNLKLPTPDFSKVYTLDFAGYEPGTTTWSPSTRTGATALATILKAIPGFGVTLNTYSDAPDAPARSQTMADELKALLIDLGAPADRITASGKGAAPTNKVELGLVKL